MRIGTAGQTMQQRSAAAPGGFNRRRRGFTLVEVLVVLLIASIVLTILATVLGSSFEILRTGETRTQLNASARNALNYLASDISQATAIPRMDDRDLDGYDDGDPTPADGGNGYGLDATWRVARLENSVPVVDSSIFMSWAFSDQIMTVHDNRAWAFGGNLARKSGTPPKVLRGLDSTDAIAYSSLYRMAVPASADFPYLLAGENDFNRDGVMTPGELRNTGSFAGQIYGYPEVAVVGRKKESAVMIQDLFYRRVNKSTNQLEDVVNRIRQMPIAGNITRINFSYYHNVPVYQSRSGAGSQIEVAYQDLEDGEIRWIGNSPELGSNDQYNAVPLISHWEQRQIDVAIDGAVYVDGTGATYAGTNYRLADMYPEGRDDRKLDGTHTSVGAPVGLQNWNMSAFYNEDSTGDQIADNGPIDRLAYVTTGVDNAGNPVEGGTASLRADFQPLLGGLYYQGSIDPTGIGDLGDADGIPDGDGVPDDPVPAWWLPYLRAVRITVTATPRDVIDERRSKSGQPAADGTLLYYRLDSPMPYLDAGRVLPAPDRKRDYVGQGKDIVLSKMVPVDYSYKLELHSDPQQYARFWSQITGNANPQGAFPRRVDLNYFRAASLMSADPYDPEDVIRARTADQKYYQMTP